jgi:hypothetical protein
MKKYSLLYVLIFIHDAIFCNSCKFVPGENNVLLSYVSYL